MEIIFVLYILNKAALFLERKGWLFYRKKYPKRASVADALQQINALLSRNQNPIIETRKNIDKIE